METLKSEIEASLCRKMLADSEEMIASWKRIQLPMRRRKTWWQKLKAHFSGRK